MSSADTIPGVSGSTVAFILGFYYEFITALHNCISRDKKLRKEGIIYILKLLPGFTVGMILSVLILASVIENHCYILSSAFIGLTIASIPFLALQEKSVLKEQYRFAPLALLGAAISVGLYFIRYLFSIELVDFHSLQAPQYAYLFAVNAFSMAAMLLPGISGSALLLIFGVYTPFITAAKDLLYLDFAVIPGILVSVAGMLTGSVLSIQSVKEFIEKHRGAALYLILGLVAGSLYAIIQAPAVRAVPLPPLTLQTFSIPAFLAGAAVIILMQLVKNKHRT